MQVIQFVIILFIINLKSTPINTAAIQNNTDPLLSIENLDVLDDQDEKRINKRQTEEETRKCNELRHNCLRNCGNNNSECTKKCFICPLEKIGYKNVIVEGDGETFDHTSILSGRNVTTVIKLTNLINNTNLIDIPTNVNSTNVNHIHVYHNQSSTEGGKFGLGYNKDGQCCFVVQPRVCSASTRGYRCHHRRHKTCGPQCTSRIIHAISRTKCTTNSGCNHNVGYIPQPQRQKCIYTPNWPYVSCGGNYQQSCDGCYEHYGYGAKFSYGSNEIPGYCSGCYDEGFDIGPRYRRGPVFRPFYYHQPPCYFFGNCFMPSCNMFGCFGNSYIDPVWSMPQQPPHYYVNNNQSPMYDYEISNNDDDDTESDWGVSLQKCRIVNADGSKLFKNCTDSQLNENSYAASPIHLLDSFSNYYKKPENENINSINSNDYYETDNSNPRIQRKRHARMHRRRHIIYDDD